MKNIITIGLSCLALTTTVASSVYGADAMAANLRPLKGEEFDKSFLNEMIEHHQQGIEMSKLAIRQGQSAQVKQFAEKTVSMQQKEIDEMQQMLSGSRAATDHSAMVSHDTSIEPKPRVDESKQNVTAAKENDAMNDGTAAHSMSHDQMNMESMSKLQGASGTEFDHIFVDEMIKHHKTATEMAQLAKSRSSRDDVKAFAEKTSEQQKKDIEDLKSLRKTTS